MTLQEALKNMKLIYQRIAVLEHLSDCIEDDIESEDGSVSDEVKEVLRDEMKELIKSARESVDELLAKELHE